MYSGQGSQYFQMGRDLFDHEPTFKQAMLQLDAYLVSLTGRSVIAALYCGKSTLAEPFDDLMLTHPAIFMVEIALTQVMRARGVQPDYTLGVSLGAFAAAVVSGCLSVTDALQAIVRQAEIVVERCAAGGMLAILPDEPTKDLSWLLSDCELVEVGNPRCVVVAAAGERLELIEARLRCRSLPFRRLPVGFAFHSRWIDEAQWPYRSVLRTLRVARPSVTFICTVEARSRDVLDESFFWSVARRPIRFAESIRCLEHHGPHLYIDLGPSGSLAAFSRCSFVARSASRSHATITAFHTAVRNIEQVTAEIPDAYRRCHEPLEFRC